MNKIIFLTIIIIYSNLPAQMNLLNEYSVSVLSGINFNSLQAIGGSLLLEGKSYISSKSNVKFSVGYSYLLENAEYSRIAYKEIFPTEVGNKLMTFEISNIQYNVIPISVGFEYNIYEGIVSYFGSGNFGYTIFDGEEIIKGSREFENTNNFIGPPGAPFYTGPNEFNDSCLSIGFGFGMKYNLYNLGALVINYQYINNRDFIDSNNILFGLEF